ncbi:MAG TPA: glutamate-1-semialdehyde 2,1-aminomutase, partial [Candidatus Hydrogenedentes bacterium]|nr:glutamate-1-semialdehyde 2,1-aminomutase [Candidatus Hydrogenedentota bacterium]HPV38179.1 glutamate-1-semialdehyde 2,1-aminomutase [Candidatus Hydrogenedentota bacterium]
MKRDTSAALWREANRILVGGVNSPVRAFKAVGGEPFFAASGSGPRIRDVDGNDYIDYVLSWGPLVMGHAHPHVVEAVTAAMRLGSSFGISTEAEIRLAQRVMRHFPAIEKIRFVNSGTEAVMSAIRLARGFTGADLVVKVAGCYHGHMDGLLVRAGSGLTTLGQPDSQGVPQAYTRCTLVVPYNDLEAVREVFTAYGDDVACLIVEPVAGNMGVVLPEPGYLEGVRELTRSAGALLIFDEVMTGFRAGMGGAQARYNVTPDLTVLGKVIGGGLPVGGYGGSAEIMDMLSPLGPVYQAGTLSGNPLAMAAGLATLDALEQPGVFERIENAMTVLARGLGDIARSAGIPVYQTQAGSMACLFFNERPVRNYEDATASDTSRYAAFFRGMLERGVYFAPSQFEACFMSAAHTSAEIDQTLEAARHAFQVLAQVRGSDDIL